MSLLASLRETSPPSVAVELASHRVSAAALDMRGGQPVVSAHASEPLPAGALVPSLTGVNVQDRATLVGALGRVLDRLGGRPRRIGLVIPDPVAKVSLVRFVRVPARSPDLDELVRWQVRKTSPFPIEDAQVSYVPGLHAEDGQEFIVATARRAAIEEYEGLCAEVGSHAGLVDLATFNIINAVLAGSPRAESTGDWLLVNVAPDYASIAIVRGEQLIFFRNRASDTDGTVADLVHQTAMYYEDRLKGAGFSAVVLAGASGTPEQSAEAEEIRRGLEQRLGVAVAAVDPRTAAALTDRIAAAPALLDTLAPLVGLLLRARRTA